jgi:energy-converting hydrogenase Eha subunit E
MMCLRYAMTYFVPLLRFQTIIQWQNSLVPTPISQIYFNYNWSVTLYSYIKTTAKSSRILIFALLLCTAAMNKQTCRQTDRKIVYFSYRSILWMLKRELLLIYYLELTQSILWSLKHIFQVIITIFIWNAFKSSKKNFPFRCLNWNLCVPSQFS